MGYVNKEKMNNNAFILLCFLIILPNTFGQNPKPIIQKSFNGSIKDIKISPNKKHFITLEGDTQSIGGFDIKLWDYNSKIIITQHHFDGENGVGSGKLKLLNNGIIIYSKNHLILKYNLLTNEKEVLFKVEWPEYIHNFMNYSSSNLVVSTKLYSEKYNKIDDITNRSNLYIIEENLVKTKKEYEFEIPTIEFDSVRKNIVIGNNKGDVYFYDLNLKETHSKLSFFKRKAISFLHVSKKGFVIANPALPFGNDKNSYSNLKEGIFKILNINDDLFDKTIELPKQNAPKKEADEFSLITFDASNIIKDIIVHNENLVISYGFNKIDFLNLDVFELNEKGPQNVNYNIEKIYMNPKSDELLFSYGPIQMISNALNLAVYNTKFKKNTFEFKKKPTVLKNAKSLNIVGTNYFFVEALKTNSYLNGNDSIVLQSPIYQDSKVVKCNNCSISFNNYNSEWIIADNRNNVFIGNPTNLLLKNDRTELSFDFDKDVNEYVVNQKKLFNNTKKLKLSNSNNKFYKPDILASFKHSNTLLSGIRKLNGGYYLAILNSDGSIKILFEEKHNYSFTTSNDGKFFGLSYASGKNNIMIDVYDTSSWTKVIAHKTKGVFEPEIVFDSSNEFLYFQKQILDKDGFETYALMELDLKSGINSLKQIHQGEFYDSYFVDRDTKLIYLNDSEYVKKINYQTNSTLYKESSSFSLKPSYFDKKNDKIIVNGGEFVTIFDRNSDERLQFYFFPEQQLIGITNEGYYMTTPNFPLDVFGFVIGENGYSFSQFDLLYNRPDKVLEILKFPRQEEVNLFKAAYNKRLKQQEVKIDAILTNITELPTTEIILSNTSFSAQKKDYLIKVTFKDSLINLKSYNIWINGVPVFGSKGKTIQSNTNVIEENVTLQLSKGNNKIEVSCTNRKGLESLRKSISVFYDAKKENENLIFVGIGVSKYQDSSFNLTYASKDVKDMSKYIKSLESEYNSIDIIMLLDEEVTSEKVKSIKQRLINTNIEDKVIIFYAGHGLLDKTFNYYLATNNVDFKNPKENGLAYKDLEGLLDNIPARQKLLLIDACHSGEIDKESISNIETDFNSSHVKLGFRGSTGVSVKDETIQNAFDLMQNTFTDLRLGTGATVISSSSGLEFAYEGEEWKNGVFTYAFLEGLKKGTIDINEDKEIRISEIKSYVSKKVITLTKGKQKPNTRAKNIELDWVLD